jgi:hypothetical protein
MNPLEFRKEDDIKKMKILNYGEGHFGTLQNDQMSRISRGRGYYYRQPSKRL